MKSPSDSERAEAVERARVTAQELSWALRSTNRAAAEVDHALAARIGLRDLDFAAMGHVMSQEGTPLGPAELGHKLGISTGSATELADRLERAGHISRTRDDKDRRRVSLVPENDSVERILGELTPLFDSLDNLTHRFSAVEQQAIARYLRLAAQELTDYAAALGRTTTSDRDTPSPRR